MEEVGTAEQGSRLRKPLRQRPLGESNRAFQRTYKVLTARAQKAQWVWEWLEREAELNQKGHLPES